jgi:integrase
VRDGFIARNPAALVTRPGVERREANYLGASDVASVLKAAETSRYYAALVLIASTGLRRGEALALSWDTSIVNLDEGWLRVRKIVGRVGKVLVLSEPKTDRLRRTVPLSPAVAAVLRKHKAAQLPNGCGLAVSGGNRASSSRRTGRTRRPAQPTAGHRGCRPGGRRRARRCTHCDTRRQLAGSRLASTSRLWLTSWVTAPSASRATFTATPLTLRRAAPWTGGATRSACDR